jgi:hypothetical protein
VMEVGGRGEGGGGEEREFGCRVSCGRRFAGG